MTDRSMKQPPGVDDLLAPPPFGVAETTGDQLLPIATSMEQVLDEDRASEPDPEPEPRAEPVVAVPEAVLTKPVSPAMRMAAPQQSATASRRPFVGIAVAVVLLGSVGFVWMRQRAAPEEHLEAGAGSPANGGPAADAADALGKSGEPISSARPLPTDLEALRALSFEERHAGLAQRFGEIPVALHIGLDLVQAQQSAEPCQTFSDALSSIEASTDLATFDWAVDEAIVPSEPDARSCKGLTQRLAAARQLRVDDDVSTKSPSARDTTGKTGRRKR